MIETPDELRARLDALHVAATDGWPSAEPAVLFRDALEDAWPTIDGLLAQLASWRTAAEAELRRRGQVEEERDALLARLATVNAENVELRKGCDELVDALADIDRLEARLDEATS